MFYTHRYSRKGAVERKRWRLAHESESLISKLKLDDPTLRPRRQWHQLAITAAAAPSSLNSGFPLKFASVISSHVRMPRYGQNRKGGGKETIEQEVKKPMAHSSK